MSIRERIISKLKESHSMNMLHLGMMMAAAGPRKSSKTFKELKKGWKKGDEKGHIVMTNWMAKKSEYGSHGEHYKKYAYHPAHDEKKGAHNPDIKIITTTNKSTNPHDRHKVVHKDGKVEYYISKEPRK